MPLPENPIHTLVRPAPLPVLLPEELVQRPDEALHPAGRRRANDIDLADWGHHQARSRRPGVHGGDIRLGLKPSTDSCHTSATSRGSGRTPPPPAGTAGRDAPHRPRGCTSREPQRPPWRRTAQSSPSGPLPRTPRLVFLLPRIDQGGHGQVLLLVGHGLTPFPAVRPNRPASGASWRWGSWPVRSLHQPRPLPGGVFMASIHRSVSAHRVALQRLWGDEEQPPPARGGQTAGCTRSVGCLAARPRTWPRRCGISGSGRRTPPHRAWTRPQCR